MKAEALLDRHPEPSREEIAHALLGNLCRCTGYVKVVDAIELAAAARRGEPLPVPDRSGRVGSRTRALPRLRSSRSATSRSSATWSCPGWLHGALRFSDHPRARVLRIDTVGGRGAPRRARRRHRRRRPRRADAGLDHEGLAPARRRGRDDRVRRRRDRGRRRGDTARRPRGGGARRGRVRGARPRDRPLRGAGRRRAEAPRGRERALGLARSTRGDVDAALAGAAHVVTESFRTQFIEHAFLEPESSLAVPDADGPLRVYSQGQGIWDDRRQIASFLGLPEERVRVTQVATGGAFGAKEDLGRPVPRARCSRRSPAGRC